MVLLIAADGCSRRGAKEEGRLVIEVAAPTVPARALEQPAVHPVYPYSVVAGGVHSAEEIREAAAKDPVVGKHYQGVRLERVKRVELKRPGAAYVSYRIGDEVYWTREKVALKAGEELYSDGDVAVRGRCGNLVSETPRTPVAPEVKSEPHHIEFETPMPMEPSQPRNDSWRAIAEVPVLLPPEEQEKKSLVEGAMPVGRSRELGFINGSSGGMVGGVFGMAGGGGGGGMASPGGGGATTSSVTVLSSGGLTYSTSSGLLAGFGSYNVGGGGSSGGGFNFVTWNVGGGSTITTPPQILISWTPPTTVIGGGSPPTVVWWTPPPVVTVVTPPPGGGGSPPGGSPPPPDSPPPPTPPPARPPGIPVPPPPTTPTTGPTPPGVPTPEPSTLLMLIGAGLVLAGVSPRFRR